MEYIYRRALLVLMVLCGQSESANYGDYCTPLFTSCSYEGGKCDVRTEKCGCKEDTQEFNVKTGACQEDTPLGAACSNSDNCTLEEAVCQGGRCVCGEGYYDTRYPWLYLPDGRCLPYAEVESNCESQSACKDENAVCVYGVCKCSAGFVNDDGSCNPSAESGSECKSQSGCQDEQTVCVNGICQGVEVTAVVGLKSFSGTTSMNVSWSPPAESDIVACYVVRWVPYVNKSITTGTEDAGNRRVEGNAFNGVVDISNLVPGRPYHVEIASRLSCTDDGNDVFVVNVTAVTKPEIPGPISDDSDLDPGNDEITIVWERPAVGEFTKFKFLVISWEVGGVFYAYREPSGSDPKAKNYLQDYGREMNVEIQACTYFKGVEACSDKFKTVVTTIGKAPEAVREVECESIGRGKIEVKWVPPRKSNGKLTKIEVRAVPVATGLVAWLDNHTAESLNQAKPVQKVEVDGTARQALVKRLPKNQLYAIFVYAYNKAGRSEMPGSQDSYDFSDRYFDYSTRTFEGKFARFIGDLSVNFKRRGESLVPVCGPISIDDQKKPLKGPKRLRPVLTASDTISMTWMPPKIGAIAGFVAQVKNKKGCLWQYDFVCTSGCLSEILQHEGYTPYEKDVDLDLFLDFPQPDETCKEHTTVNMSRDQLFPSAKYVISGLPQSRKYFVSLKTIGYFSKGLAVQKKARKPQKARPTCDACVDPRNMAKLDELVCKSIGVFYFKNGKLTQDDQNADLKLDPGDSRFFYKSRKVRPKNREIRLPGSKSKKCACSLMKEAPAYKLAFLAVDPTGSNYIMDYIVSLEKKEMEDLYKKHRSACWRRRV